MIRKLIWKQWREQAWKLPLGCALLGGFAAIGLRARMVPDWGVIQITIMLGGFVLPILVVMDLVAAERATGSLGSLLSLPVPPWVILAVKFVTAAAVVALPILLAEAICLAVAGRREVNPDVIMKLFNGCLAMALTLLV